MSQTVHISAKITGHNKPAVFSNAVCFAVDQNYLPFAIFVANQILEKETSRDFDVVICLPDLNMAPTLWLDSPIRFCALSTQGVNDFPVDHLSLAAYYRLFLPHAFRHEYQNIIYLDADTYLTRAFLSDFFKKIPTDLVIAAAPDIANICLDCNLKMSEGHKKHLKNYLSRYESKNHTYRNSGVLIINTENYIKRNCLERILETSIENLNKLTYHDQTALNMSLLNEMQILSFEYNWQADDRINHLFENFKPALIHFIGLNKPWKSSIGFLGKYSTEYTTFLKENFPDLNNEKISSHDSAYKNRLKNPKYKNRLREDFSREIGFTRRLLHNLLKNLQNKIFRTKIIKTYIEQQIEKSSVPLRSDFVKK